MLLVVAAAARPTEDLVVAAAERRDRAPAGLQRAEAAGVLQRAGGRIGFTHPLLESAELLELARKLTPPEDGAGLLGRTVQAAEYHFDVGDATRATALLEESIATAHPGRDRARILLNQASISWLDLPRFQGRCEQALQEAEEDAGIRTTAHEHLAWVGIYRGDPAFAAKHASVSSSGRGGPPTPRSGPNRCPPWHGRIPERPRRLGPAPACREAGNHPRLGPPGLRGSATARTRVQTLHFLCGPGDGTIEAARVLHRTAE